MAKRPTARPAAPAPAAHAPAAAPTAVLSDRDATLDAIGLQTLHIDGLFARDLFAQPDTHTCAAEVLRAALAAAFEAGRRTRRPSLRRPAAPPQPTAVDGDLVLTSPKPTDGCGTWASGRIGSFRFAAKVFPEHADVASYEIGRSRISKLELRRLATGEVTYHWDRGLDIPAADAATQATVTALSERLATFLYGPCAG